MPSYQAWPGFGDFIGWKVTSIFPQTSVGPVELPGCWELPGSRREVLQPTESQSLLHGVEPGTARPSVRLV